jgi:hypothetical protein
MTDAEVTEFFNAICAERGGIDRLSITETAIAKALAGCLATEPIDPALVASLTAQFPPVCKGKIHTLNVHFVDHFDHKLERMLAKLQPDYVTPALVEELSGRITELETELKAAKAAAEAAAAELKRVPAVELANVEPRLRHHELLPPAPARALPEPVEHADAYATLAALNAGLNSSPYLPVDRFDEFGRRLDEHGVPQSRRKDRDGAA